MPASAERTRYHQFHYQQYEAHRFDYEPNPVRLAVEELDSNAFMRRRAEQLTTERLDDEAPAREDPMTDILGSARLHCAAEEEGRYDPSAEQNLRNDIRTGLFENTQENGHISVIDAPINPQGEANVAGVAYYELFLRGIHAGRPDWANELGTSNIHEEFLSSALFNREAYRQTYALMVMSALPEDVGATDKELRKEGYRPDSRKMMLRMHRFVPDGLGWKRVTEQLCVSGSDVALVNQTLREVGALPENQPDLTTTEALDYPLLMHLKDFPGGIADVAQIYDTLKEEKTGRPHFCGKASDQVPPGDLYANLLRVSQEREAALDAFTDELKTYAYQLVRDESLSFEQQDRQFKDKKLEIVRRICALHPEYAAHAFGEEAAKNYQAAYEAAESGDMNAADAALSAAFEQSTSLVECGGEITQESQSSSQESSSQSEAERIEAMHCLEIKLFGYTVRNSVNCPACSPLTGQKVRAHETAMSIRCLNDNCCYELGKDGRIIRASRINDVLSEAAEGQITAEVIDLQARRLQKGQRYQIGSDIYEYSQQVRVGGAAPVFTSSRGQRLEGEIARHLEASLATKIA